MHSEGVGLAPRVDATSAPETLRDDEPRPRRERRQRIWWSATSVPVAPLLLVGIAFGPAGLGLLSARTLSVLDAAVPVALAVLGVIVGLGLNPARQTDRQLLAAGAVEAMTTASVIAVGLWLAAIQIPGTVAEPVWPLAVVAGLCGASSLAVPSIRGGDLSPAQRLLELDVLVPIAGGGLALAFLREGSAIGAVSLTLQACAVILVVAVATWLLLGQGPAETEGRVFTIATLMLVGGAADYLSFSALMGGLLAGAFWRAVGGGVRDGIERDALRVRHPLVVLVLLAAGASVELTETALALGAFYAVLRIAGKLLGGAIAHFIDAVSLSPGIGLRLLPPGAFGIAFAMNALRAGGPQLAPVLTIAVIGTVLAEVVAAVVGPREERT
jgi:hypothetical protein